MRIFTDPSDSIDVIDDDAESAESLDELGMSVRTSDELDEDDAVVAVAGADDEAADVDE